MTEPSCGRPYCCPDLEVLKHELKLRMDEIDRLLAGKDQYFESRMTGIERSMATALATSKEAIQKAETATEKRFDSVNEFRAALSDQTQSFITRAEAEAGQRLADVQLQNMAAAVVALRLEIGKTEGRRGGLTAGWGYLLGAAGFVLVVIDIFLTLR